MLFKLCVVVVAVLVHYTDAGGDIMQYDVKAQAKCKEVVRGPTRDCRWPSGMNMMVDQVAAGGRIIAYKIQWFNGAWSGWYVPGYNDVDHKFNVVRISCSMPYNPNSLRRIWSYFYDHNHKFIIFQP